MSSDSSSSFIGWLITLAVLVAAVYFWRTSLAITSVIALAGILTWVGYRFISKSGRAQSSIDEKDYANALKLLQERGDADQLISALRFKIPFPSEIIKSRVVTAVKELLALGDAAAEPSNHHLPDELRDDIGRRTAGSLASLWPLCQKLALVARAKASPEQLADQLGDVERQLEDLATHAETTRHQLARITLGAAPLEIHHAIEQVGAMKWQVGELQRLDSVLEGRIEESH